MANSDKVTGNSVSGHQQFQMGNSNQVLSASPGERSRDFINSSQVNGDDIEKGPNNGQKNLGVGSTASINTTTSIDSKGNDGITEWNWPSISDFTVQMGETKLEEFILAHFKLEPEWVFHITFLQQHTSQISHKFVFESKFGMPNQDMPIPEATVSTFWVFEINHFADRGDSVKVYYVLEATRFPIVPGQVPFQTKWLYGIIRDKMRLQSLLTLGEVKAEKSEKLESPMA